MRPSLIVAGLAFVTFLGISPCAAIPQQRTASAPDPTFSAVAKAEEEGRLADAERILLAAIHEAEQDEANSRNNPQLSLYLNMLAGLLVQKHQYSEAVALTKRALEIDRNVFGPTHPRVGSALGSLGSLYQIQGQNEEAERLLRQAFEIMRGNPKADALSTLLILNGLSSLYLQGQRWTEAEALLLEGMKLCDSGPRLAAGKCAEVRRSLANLYRRQGKTAEGDELLSRSAERAITSGGRASDVVMNLNNIASRYEAEGLYGEAAAAYGRAIAWIEKNRGPNDPEYLSFELNGVGRLLEKQGRILEAEKAYKRALELRFQGANAERAYIAEGLGIECWPLLNLYRSEGRLSEIEPVLSRALDIQESLLGPRHSQVADTLLTLADVYEQEGKYSQAGTLYERAIRIQETNWGNDHPRLIGTLVRYEDLMRKLNETEKAAEVEARIKTIREKQAAPQKD